MVPAAGCTEHAARREGDIYEEFDEARRRFMRDSLAMGDSAVAVGTLGVTMTPAASAQTTMPGSARANAERIVKGDPGLESVFYWDAQRSSDGPRSTFGNPARR